MFKLAVCLNDFKKNTNNAECLNDLLKPHKKTSQFSPVQVSSPLSNSDYPHTEESHHLSNNTTEDKSTSTCRYVSGTPISLNYTIIKP